MTHGSLFSGIGGFDLAAEWMGWQNIFHCEIEPFCQRVLKYHFPKSILHENIKETDFTKYRGTVDVLSGGFPCQPYSVAGKRKGKDDERHLWPEMLRAIREIQPTWVIGENVSGLVNWNGGMVFDEVQTDLEIEGYEVIPFILPAAGVNAPHKRERVWFVAYSESNRNRGKLHRMEGSNGSEWESKEHGENNVQFGNNGEKRNVTNSESWRTRGLRNEEKKTRTRKGHKLFGSKCSIPNWHNFPTQSPICCGDDGIPDRLDGITFQKWRNESIKAYGNAVVPQIPYMIYKAIEQFETL